ncbi:MAG: lysine transporter LysE [Flavobacteriaceae bacterium]|nr:MAG: lysine transporter LysE [Flavobacteriaceae bacterium]
MEIDVLLSFITASVLLTMMPGPDIVFVLMQSVSFGKKEGILTALGLVLGIIVHTTLVAFGVSAVIQQSSQLFVGIKIFGALYLCYLAYQVFRANSGIEINTMHSKRSGTLRLIGKGFIMNVLNPKVTLFFLAFFPGFLFSDTLSSVLQFYILGLLFMLQAMCIFTAVSLFAGKFSRFIKENQTLQTRIKWLQITVFLLMAFFLILN